MNPYYEPPNLGSSFQQAHADRPERPGRQIDGIPSIGVLRLVNGLESAVRRRVGGISRWRQRRTAVRELQALYQISMIMTHRDGLPRFSARSVRRGDAGHREACATPSKSLGKPPFRSRWRPAGGRRKALTMHSIARAFPPTRRTATAISMGHYHRDLVLSDHHLTDIGLDRSQIVSRVEEIIETGGQPV